MVGDAATNVASKVRPSDEALASIDRPAEDNTWHDAPDFSKANVKSQIQNVYKGDPKNDAREAASTTTSAAQTQDGRVDPSGATQTLANQVNARIPDEKKENVKQSANETAQAYRARTKEYLSKKMPEERRERTIWRLKVSWDLNHWRICVLTIIRKWCSNANSTPTIRKLSPRYLTWLMSMAAIASGLLLMALVL